MYPFEIHNMVEELWHKWEEHSKICLEVQDSRVWTGLVWLRRGPAMWQPRVNMLVNLEIA